MGKWVGFCNADVWQRGRAGGRGRSKNSKFRMLGNCVGGLRQKWEGGLVFEKLVYGSMERAAEIPKTIPLAKKGIGM